MLGMYLQEAFKLELTSRTLGVLRHTFQAIVQVILKQVMTVHKENSESNIVEIILL